MSSSTFVRSTLILTIATLVSKILGSIFRIPLQNIAGDEVLGIFNLVYPVYMVALTLSVAGIPIAISKLISEARANQDEAEIKNIFTTAGILAFSFGILSFTIIYSFSDQIAHVLGGDTTRLALIIVAMTLLIAPYMAVYRGFFQGFEDMRPTALSQVLEQLIRVALILGVAYFLVKNQYSNEIVAGGVMIGSSIGAFASLVYLWSKYRRSAFRPQIKGTYSFAQFKRIGGTILKISLPICIGAITMALLNFVDSVTIPGALRTLGHSTADINHLYGIYGRGLALVQIATVVSTSIVLPLIPYVTRALANNAWDETKRVVNRAHELTHFVSWPAAFGLLALTLPVNLALFTNVEGSFVLAIISFSSLFTSLTVLGTGVLQGMNQENRAAMIIIVGVAAKFVLNIILVRTYGLAGAAFSTAMIYVLLFFVNTYFIFRTIQFSVWKKETAVFAFSSIVMGAVVGIPTLFFNIADWSRLQALGYTAAALIMGGAVYIGLVILLKGLDRDMLASLPGVKKFLREK